MEKKIKNIVVIGREFDLFYGVDSGYDKFYQDYLIAELGYNEGDLKHKFPFLLQPAAHEFINWAMIKNEYERLSKLITDSKKITSLNNAFTFIEQQVYDYFKYIDQKTMLDFINNYQITSDIKNFFTTIDQIINFNFTNTLTEILSLGNLEYIKERIIHISEFLSCDVYDSNEYEIHLHIVGHSLQKEYLTYIKEYLLFADEITIYDQQETPTKMQNLKSFYQLNTVEWRNHVEYQKPPVFLKCTNVDAYSNIKNEQQLIEDTYFNEFDELINEVDDDIDEDGAVGTPIISGDVMYVNKENIDFIGEVSDRYFSKCTKIVFQGLNLVNNDHKKHIDNFIFNMPKEVIKINFIECFLEFNKVEFINKDLEVLLNNCEVFINGDVIAQVLSFIIEECEIHSLNKSLKLNNINNLEIAHSSLFEFDLILDNINNINLFDNQYYQTKIINAKEIKKVIINSSASQFSDVNMQLLVDNAIDVTLNNNKDYQEIEYK